MNNIIESMLELNDSDIDAPRTKRDLELLGESLSEMDTIKNLGTMYQAKILYHVHKNWNNIDTQITGFWQYDFYKWAQKFTQNDQSIPHKSTIDNKIAVYRDYVAEKLIEIPQNTDIMSVSYTKLLYARTTARARKMTPELWSMVFDKSISAKSLLAELKEFKQSDNVSLFIKDGIIYVHSLTNTLAIGYLDGECKYIDKELWKLGMEKLAKFCKLDEFVL